MYVVYETRNVINDKIYIGVHKQKDKKFDGYLGSGTILKRSIEKHGEHNFVRRILYCFETKEDAYEKEKDIVTEEFISSDHNYNIMIGGSGGFYVLNKDSDRQKQKAIKSNIKQKELAKNEVWLNHKKTAISAALYSSTKFKEAMASRKGQPSHFLGKNHTDEAKSKIGLNSSLHQKGSNNSQYGTIWITDGKINKKINKNGVIPKSFHKGRSC